MAAKTNQELESCHNDPFDFLIIRSVEGRVFKTFFSLLMESQDCLVPIVAVLFSLIVVHWSVIQLFLACETAFFTALRAVRSHTVCE